MIKLAVSGCLGRMGQRISRLALADKAFKVTTLLEHKDHPQIHQPMEGLKVSVDSNALKGCQVLIEFTTPEATLQNLAACLKHKVKMVIGTTGMSPEQIKKIKSASKKIPIVFSSNMSVGVNIVFKLTEMAALKTGHNYVINLSETHHVHKKDAPSGTAKTIAEIAEHFSKQKVANIESIREGEVIGDHTITFESDEDVISIFHHAKSRDIFAKGSLVAAKFLAKKKSGLYNMQDVLGLK
jgi:4-hydroxy-tetrahydrodipicolinate reductase